jgi:hypothetical protein
MNVASAPAHVQAFIDVIGEAQTARLIEALGGAPAYVSRRPQGGLAVEAVGVDAVRALAAAFGHGMIRIPSAKPWLVARLHAEGHSGYHIARRLKLSERAVRRMLSARAGGEQTDLFADAAGHPSG